MSAACPCRGLRMRADDNGRTRRGQPRNGSGTREEVGQRNNGPRSVLLPVVAVVVFAALLVALLVSG